MAFSYAITKNGKLATLSLAGRLVDKGEAVEISVEIEQELEDGTHHFIIDLAELEYMNSTGLNILINLMNKTKNEGGAAVIVGAKPRIDALFSVTKLSSVFTMMKNMDEAILYFQELSESR